MFEGCTTRELDLIARAGTDIVMTAGTTIIDQGQTGREAFVVLDGTVTVRRNGRRVAELGPGAMIGELSLLDHGPRTATVTCDTDCELFVLDQRHFMGVLHDTPQLAARLLAHLARMVREMDRRSYG
jgi:CRP-like cAMP-binding protein